MYSCRSPALIASTVFLPLDFRELDTSSHKAGRATKLYRAKNAEASPYRYKVDDRDLFRIYKECSENDWDFIGIYHSHTASEAYPSPTDVRLAFWPEAYYILVSTKDPGTPVIRAYRILDGEITEEPIVEP